MKTGGAFFIFIIFLSLLSTTIVIAQETNQDQLLNLEEFTDADLELKDPGLTPDSPFYFFDEFFDQFSKNREEKIAEVTAMIEKGDFESAREALEQYQSFAQELEEEISPEEREEVRKSAAAIQNALETVKEDIPEDELSTFFEEVIAQETRVVTAVEIATKIKDLCVELANVDPNAFYETCKTDESSPEWQEELFDDLSAEQEKEARAFFSIMSECFENPQECRCEDISVEAFAAKCSVAAPLAVECDFEGNEDACEELNEITEGMMDLLPPHLLQVITLIDSFQGEDEFYGGPEECEGVTDKLECEEIIFRNDAPTECVDALDAGKFSFEGTGEAHEECEQILFEVHSPEECVEAGVSDPRKCSALVFETYAPRECLDAGLTGESPEDNELCDELMEDLYEDEVHDSFGANCQDIDDSEARLNCYDSAFSFVQDYDAYEEEPYYEFDEEPAFYEDELEEFEEPSDLFVGETDDFEESDSTDVEEEIEIDETESPEEFFEEESIEDEDSNEAPITGEVTNIGGFITGNAFLDYFFD